MVIVDANVLLYSVNESAPQHERAKRWIEAALSGSEPVGLAWVVLLAFLRLTTLPAVFFSPLRPQEALDLMDEWLSASAAVLVNPGRHHASLLRGLLTESGTGGNLVSDAHLAALALEHDARVCTFDRDFARFAEVKAFAPE